MLTLYQFLLAGLDRPWLDLGPARAPMDQTAQFSQGRLLFIALWRAALSFLLGLGLTHTASPLWFAWPSGILAALAAAQALVVFGLGAVVWNQRAARLRANQAPAPLPPEGLFAWFAAFAYACILWWITPLALFAAFETCRAEIAWRTERARLVAAGEKLTIREVLGPEVPAAQNAGAAAIFAPAFDYKRIPDPNERSGLSTTWRGTNATQTLSRWVWFPAPFLPPKKGKDYKASRANSDKTPLVNLDDWVEYYRESQREALDGQLVSFPPWITELRFPEGTNDSARVVLSFLEHTAPALAEIDSAGRLPRSQFPLHYEEAFATLLPHLTELIHANEALQVRCAARLATGQTNLAAEDVDSAWRVAELLREEPFLISQMVRDRQSRAAAGTLWQGLAFHTWNDADLARWQNLLARIDYRKGLAAAFEAERLLAFNFLDGLIASPASSHLGGLSFPANDEDGWSRLQTLAGSFFGRAFIRQNEVALSRFSGITVNGVERWTQATPPGSLLDLLPAFAAAEGERKQQTAFFSPYTAILQMLAPSLRNSAVKTAQAEAIARMAAVACALERYRLAHGEYPESLAALSLALMVSIPSDPVTRKPIHYSRTDDGWFLLSCGNKDESDNTGVHPPGKEQDVFDWIWPVPTRPAHQNLF